MVIINRKGCIVVFFFAILLPITKSFNSELLKRIRRGNVKSVSFNHIINQLIDRVHKLPNQTYKGDSNLVCKKVTTYTDISWGYAGCDKKVIKQTHCQGQCSSIFVPARNRHLQNCTSCTITKRRYKNVKLHCKNGIRRVKVAMAEECSCVKCELDFSNNVPSVPWKAKSSGSPYSCDYIKKKRMKRRKIERRKRKKRNKLSKVKVKKNMKKKKRNKGNRTRFNTCKTTKKRNNKKVKERKIQTKSKSVPKKKLYTFRELLKLMSVVKR